MADKASSSIKTLSIVHVGLSLFVLAAAAFMVSLAPH